MSASNQAITRHSATLKSNYSEQSETGIDPKSVREMSENLSISSVKDSKRNATFGKTDPRYWQQAGKLISDTRWSGAFSCKVQVAGRRETFPLRTKNKATAATKAAKIYGDVVALGWIQALAKHKPDAAKPAKGSTVGDLLVAVSGLAAVTPATLRGYTAAFRRIVADIHGLEAKASRYARCGVGREAWVAAADAVPLETITPALIESWKLRYVAKKAGKNEFKARAARNSSNTRLRQAKGLFAKRLLNLIKDTVALPSPLPFDGVGFWPRQSMRYTSTMDLQSVLAAVRDDLAINDKEAFKAFSLCLFAGLRRNEADKLRWRSVDFEAGLIRIEAQADFSPKAETSLGDVPIDAELCAILRGLRAKELKADYVLATGTAKTKQKQVGVATALTWSKYRADDTFKRLADWLRAHGVASRTPLHTLRKEAGSLICAKHGLFAASRFLRHADIAITAQHYAAQKERVTIGLGAMLARASANIVEADFKPAQKPSKSKRKARRT
jgi:integrase